MKIKFFLILTFIIINLRMFSQSAFGLDYSESIEAINYFSKSSIFILSSCGSGTGTLFSVPLSDSSEMGASYLATAFHVVAKLDSIGKVVIRCDTITAILNVIGGTKESKKYVSVMSFPALDIAIFRPIEFKRRFREYDVTTPSITDIAEFSDLKKGQLSFLAGYPYGVGTKSSRLNPVTQSGVIAFVDTLSSLVLVDIHVNHGNSGCPVFVVTDSGIVKLLGLVFEYQPSETDFVLREVNNKTVPVPVNTGLGRVVMIRPLLPLLQKLPH